MADMNKPIDPGIEGLAMQWEGHPLLDQLRRKIEEKEQALADREGLLTDQEHAALAATAEIWNKMTPTLSMSDAAEFALLLHNVQNFIMARAAARAYPDRYRL